MNEEQKVKLQKEKQRECKGNEKRECKGNERVIKSGETEGEKG